MVTYQISEVYACCHGTASIRAECYSSPVAAARPAGSAASEPRGASGPLRGGRALHLHLARASAAGGQDRVDSGLGDPGRSCFIDSSGGQGDKDKAGARGVKNVDTMVDLRSGEVHPKAPGGRLGDSIGSVHDVLGRRVAWGT